MLLFVVAVAPGVFWLWYFLRRDHLRPEPRGVIVHVFLLGALSGLAAGVLERAVLRQPALMVMREGLWNLVLVAAFVGLVEEGMKFLAIYAGAYRRAEFNEVLDGIVYAVAAAMGFATLENIGYVMAGGLTVGAIRAVISVPGHAYFSSIMGLRMGLAKFAGKGETGLLVTGLLLAALAHAIFDGLLFTRTAFALLALPLSAFLWHRAVRGVKKAQLLDDLRARRT